jgi:hypothetical protein
MPCERRKPNELQWELLPDSNNLSAYKWVEFDLGMWVYRYATFVAVYAFAG